MPKSVLSLGKVSGPLLIFGGPYSNLQALQALRQQAEALSIPAENCICTGDIVAYCAQPKETVDAIRDWGIHCLMGNCEESFADNSEDCGCGFTEGSHCDLLSSQWFQFANQQLTQDHRQWFSTLPDHMEFTLNRIKAIVVHGSVSSINQFIFASSDYNVFHHELSLTNADLVIGGHCGIPFTKMIDQQLWHNSGAIGMPANDGTPHTWFSIIEPDHSKKITISTHKLHYDHQQAAHEMGLASMNNSYAKALASGLWPSMDILPTLEKKQRGVEIEPSVVTYAPTK